MTTNPETILLLPIFPVPLLTTGNSAGMYCQMSPVHEESYRRKTTSQTHASNVLMYLVFLYISKGGRC